VIASVRRIPASRPAGSQIIQTREASSCSLPSLHAMKPAEGAARWKGSDQKSSGSASRCLPHSGNSSCPFGQPHRFAGLVAPDDGTILFPNRPSRRAGPLFDGVRRGISR